MTVAAPFIDRFKNLQRQMKAETLVFKGNVHLLLEVSLKLAKSFHVFAIHLFSIFSPKTTISPAFFNRFWIFQGQMKANFNI